MAFDQSLPTDVFAGADGRVDAEAGRIFEHLRRFVDAETVGILEAGWTDRLILFGELRESYVRYLKLRELVYGTVADK